VARAQGAFPGISSDARTSKPTAERSIQIRRHHLGVQTSIGTVAGTELPCPRSPTKSAAVLSTWSAFRLGNKHLPRAIDCEDLVDGRGVASSPGARLLPARLPPTRPEAPGCEECHLLRSR